MKTTAEILKSAKQAAADCCLISADQRTEALKLMADALIADESYILEQNACDVRNAEGQIAKVMIDRLSLNSERIAAMAEGIRQVAGLPDKVGYVKEKKQRPNGLIIEKVLVPMGVVAIIYESRPNVTSDAAALTVKSGNVCILRSSRTAFLSANAIVKAMRKGLISAGLNENIISLIQDTTRDSANELMSAAGYVDLLIPRGGAGLINACVENAKVNCIQTGTGICHIYVDDKADVKKALDIVNNAKTSRPSVCNAAEVCLVNEKIADSFLPQLKDVLVDDRVKKGLVPVELRLDARTSKIINGIAAEENDFDTEFLDYKMAVGIVKDVHAAITHINTHSTGHSEAIITEDRKHADLFTAAIDSSSVYVNASTRFTDGGEFGLGCEMGISTQKLHARGPMGIEELMTYKYVIHGEGQIR